MKKNIEKNMEPNDAAAMELFRENLMDEYAKNGVRGALIMAVSLLVSIYAGRNIYGFPPAIMYLKIAAIVILGLYIFLALAFGGKNNKLVSNVLAATIISIVAFAMAFSIIVGVSAPEHTARAAQVTMVIIIGCVLFSGAIRDRMEKIISFNLAGFVVVMLAVNGFSIVKIFDFYMVIVCAVSSVVFNRIYTKSLFKEFMLKRELNEKLNQLKSEIGEKEEIQEKLVDMAYYDSLTRTYSRRQGLEIFERQFRRCKSEKRELSICYMDIDNLKDINDNYGHAEGDRHILDFTELVGECIRDTDYCIRLGGDEFLMVLPFSEQGATKAVIERIGKKIQKINKDRSNSHGMSVSHGSVSISTRDYKTYNEMIADADMRMYKEKIQKKDA